MNLKLDVDVHVAAGEDGLMLVVGGLIRPLTGRELETILSGKPLKRDKRRKPAKVLIAGKVRSPKPNPHLAWREEKAKAGICQWCTKKAVKGKRLCGEHMAVAARQASKARSAKVKAAA